MGCLCEGLFLVYYEYVFRCECLDGYMIYVLVEVIVWRWVVYMDVWEKLGGKRSTFLIWRGGVHTVNSYIRSCQL